MQTPCLKQKITGSRDHLGAPCDGVINFTTDIQVLGVAFCSIQTNQIPQDNDSLAGFAYELAGPLPYLLGKLRLSPIEPKSLGICGLSPSFPSTFRENPPFDAEE